MEVVKNIFGVYSKRLFLHIKITNYSTLDIFKSTRNQIPHFTLALTINHNNILSIKFNQYHLGPRIREAASQWVIQPLCNVSGLSQYWLYHLQLCSANLGRPAYVASNWRWHQLLHDLANQCRYQNYQQYHITTDTLPKAIPVNLSLLRVFHLERPAALLLFSQVSGTLRSLVFNFQWFVWYLFLKSTAVL